MGNNRFWRAVAWAAVPIVFAAAVATLLTWLVFYG